jgi:hypothetical protein
MPDTTIICFSKVAVFVIILLLIGITIYYFKYVEPKKTKSCPSCPSCESCPACEPCNIIPTERPYDYVSAVLNDDYRRAYDPLVEPSRRPSLDQLPPPWFQNITNIRTRPYFDAPAVVGILTKIVKTDNKIIGENPQSHEASSNLSGNRMKMDDILQLYGYRDDINTYKFNYYAITKDGIKLEVHVPRNTLELNNNDSVLVLGTEYIVTLYTDKIYRYNPYAI